MATCNQMMSFDFVIQLTPELIGPRSVVCHPDQHSVMVFSPPWSKPVGKGAMKNIHKRGIYLPCSHSGKDLTTRLNGTLWYETCCHWKVLNVSSWVASVVDTTMKWDKEPFSINHDWEVRYLNICRVMQGYISVLAVESHWESCILIVLDRYNRMFNTFCSWF